MHRFRARFRRALLVALPSACVSSHPAAVSSSSGRSSTSSTTGASSTTGSFGTDLCGSCYRQGMVCNHDDTACVVDCSQCSCTPLLAPIGPTDGGYPDGGLALGVCAAACPDPHPLDSGYPDLDWVVTSCFAVDAGCSHLADGGGFGPGGCVQCLVVDCGGGVGRLTAGHRLRGGAPSNLATYLQRGAHLEALSVQSFEVLAADLSRLGAPPSLVRRARRASVEEWGHARALRHFARRHGAVPLPIPELAPTAPRSALTIAQENSHEGCLRETWGATVAAVQARQARDPALRRALSVIATEEAEHARLGWDLAAWFETQLTRSEARRLRQERQRAIAAVEPERFRDPPRALLDEAGMPTAAQQRHLWASLRAEVWS